MSVIRAIRALEILDSRGRPTVEVAVTLADGSAGRASVPSGASTGSAEALELRDRDPRRYRGLGVLRAVGYVNTEIAARVVGMDALDQGAIDRALVQLDGTPDKSRLGANALLGVSLAVARAAAASAGLPLYRYLGGAGTPLLPLPMVNIISGGMHAGQNLDIQDVLVIPVGADTYHEALAWIVAVYWAAGELLQERGYSALCGDEGGYGPALGSNEEALALVTAAIERAGFRPGHDLALAVDVASSHFYRSGRYQMGRDGRSLNAAEMVEVIGGWLERYPLISVEDGLAEEDWEGWAVMTRALGGRTQLIGDDLFATQVARLRRGIGIEAGNAILVKVNQVGTLTEALTALRVAQEAGVKTVVSARSGETEDAFIADLAVATGAGQLKVGSVVRSERLAKWNRLLQIEDELGPGCAYAGGRMLSSWWVESP